MRKAPLVALSATALALAGCASGSGRVGPDEFATARAAPLVVPPDFALRPPAPGEPRPQEVSASTQALQALFGGPAQRSAAESATLTEAGRATAAPGIRSSVADPATTVVDKGTTTQEILAAPEGDGQEARAAVPQ